jgi:hypothetical protein
VIFVNLKKDFKSPSLISPVFHQPNFVMRDPKHKDALLRLIELEVGVQQMGQHILQLMRHPEATDADITTVRTMYVDIYKKFSEAQDAVFKYKGEAK